MNKILLLIAVVSFALPSFARSNRNHRDNRVSAKAHPYNTAVQALEDLYGITYQRSVDLSCYAKKPNTLQRIFKTKKYRQHKNRKLNSDLCDIEFDRIDTAADNIEFLSRARFRNAQAVVNYALDAADADISEREDRMSALDCGNNRDNKDLCKVEKKSIRTINADIISKLLKVSN